MTLLIAALIGLLALTASRDPGGRLWRRLVEAPARALSGLTWRHVAVVALSLVFLQLFAQLAMPHLAVVLAVDVVGWIDVLAATLIVTRLLPGWRALKVAVRRGLVTAHRVRPRAPRARRIRRPDAKPSDDPDPAGWAPAFA
ncbi:hypothetical protein [Caulobacter sp. RL271]|uniref:Uncharacterized protein n=1 Tax=Caulobacter segnis TaxID=88688 RepID=A0ABY4ZVV5_9CAUL|nr:hypothetical protein [Caulobacter segnis]USQ96843.1 hypothetical protein MZV50_04545 [Caulobacter segnis]